MVDDGRSAHPTMTTAETPRSPTRAEIGRDAIGRRTVPHAIRHRATGDSARDPATGDTARDEPDHTRSGDGPFPPRRAIRDGVTGNGRYGTRRASRVRKCPEMPGIGLCSDMPGYARLCPMMSRCRDRPATALRDASGPTIRVRCAAGRCGERH